MLYEAARSGHVQLLKCLLAGGVSYNYVDADANTALHHAVIGLSASACSLLLHMGKKDKSINADAVNADRQSPWDLALQCGEGSVRRAFSPTLSDSDLEPFINRNAGERLPSKKDMLQVIR